MLPRVLHLTSSHSFHSLSYKKNKNSIGLLKGFLLYLYFNNNAGGSVNMTLSFWSKWIKSYANFLKLGFDKYYLQAKCSHITDRGEVQILHFTLCVSGYAMYRKQASWGSRGGRNRFLQNIVLFPETSKRGFDPGNVLVSLKMNQRAWERMTKAAHDVCRALWHNPLSVSKSLCTSRFLSKWYIDYLQSNCGLFSNSMFLYHQGTSNFRFHNWELHSL